MALGSTCTNKFPVKDLPVCHPVLSDRHTGDLISGPQAYRTVLQGQALLEKPSSQWGVRWVSLSV